MQKVSVHTESVSQFKQALLQVIPKNQRCRCDGVSTQYDKVKNP